MLTTKNKLQKGQIEVFSERPLIIGHILDIEYDNK